MIRSKEIKEPREKIGVTQGEFKMALEVSISTVRKRESGQPQPADVRQEQLEAMKQLIENTRKILDPFKKNVAIQIVHTLDDS